MDFGNAEQALEDLRKCEADLEAYASARGLILKRDPPYPGAPPPEEQPGPIKHAVWSLVGVMPGGEVARLRHQSVFGKVMGMETNGHHTVMVARQPETVAYVPMLSVRPDEFGAGLFQWAGDGRKRQEQKFESLELDRRYVVEIAKGQEQQWLYRLFSPAFIDWLAHETPPDFAFRLSSGSFVCEAPQWRGQHRADGQVDVDHLDLLSTSGGKVAGRLRDEVLEQIGLGTVPKPRSGDANEQWTKSKRGGWLVGKILKIAGDGNDDSARGFAEARGFGPEDISEFHASHIETPLPAAATDVFQGKLPDGRAAHLAWLEYENEIDGLRYYVAVIGELNSTVPDIWFDEVEVLATADATGLPQAAVSIAREGGYGIATGGGSAIVYVTSTGWDGRPSGALIDRILADSPAIFDGLEDRVLTS
ncbi:MAG: hypothetical protein IPK93_00600 [Solirubrobacterales bacterium]|nr:hypothetical protein [Solirubrobacterales bacterium]